MRGAVFVAGATGLLGGVVARQLGAWGWSVRTVSRAPDSPAGRALQRSGVEVAAGDFDEPPSLRRAMRGVDAVFAMSTPHGVGLEAEVRHGLNLVDAAVSAEAPYVVYSSGAGANRDTGVPFYDSKQRVEARLRAAGVPQAILAPVYFMENMFNSWNLPALRAGRLPSLLPVEARMQQVAVTDAGAFAALMLARPEEFAGRRVEVASDELSARQAAGVLARLTGVEVVPVQLSSAELPPPLVALAAWHVADGYAADAGWLRQQYPEVGWHDFAAWAHTQDWGVLGAG